MWPARNSPLKRIRVLRRPEVRSILSVMDELFRATVRRCNRRANGNELKRRDLEPPIAPIFEEFLTDQENAEAWGTSPPVKDVAVSRRTDGRVRWARR